MKPSLILSLLFCAADCFACYSPPREQLVSPEELIGLSSNVSLAKAVGAAPMSDGGVEYTFVVEKHLLGNSPAVFQIYGAKDYLDGQDHAFANHTDERFWQYGGGRLINDTDCKIRPTFTVGSTYLVFLDQRVTRRSYEQIVRTDGDEDTKDQWLQLVERKVAALALYPKQPFPLKPTARLN